MAAVVQDLTTPARTIRRANQDSLLLRAVLIGSVYAFFIAVLILPLVLVFSEAFSKGVAAYFHTFADFATKRAITLTLIIAAIAVPANTIFGLAAAWCVARFDFRGKRLLNTLIDLPLWVSPVISGLVYVLLFGAQGVMTPTRLREWLAPLAASMSWGHAVPILGGFVDWLANPKIIFATPGIALATIFVTFPFVARGLIPLMQAQGKLEEEAAMTLGANGWQVFWRITIPKIRWGLLYGMILCNARAMGEFGAVSVVSGHVRGLTNTMPLQVEILYNEYAFAAAFAVASVLSLLGLVTLAIKTYIEWRHRAALQHSNG